VRQAQGGFFEFARKGQKMQISADIVVAGAISVTLLSTYSFSFLRAFLALGQGAFWFSFFSHFSQAEWVEPAAVAIGIISFLALESVWEKDCYLILLLSCVSLIGMFFFLGANIDIPSFPISSLPVIRQIHSSF